MVASSCASMNSSPAAPCVVTQRRNGPEKHRAVRAVEQREAPLGQRTADAAVDRVDHREQRGLVEQPGRTSARFRLERRDVRGEHRAQQRGHQPRLPQGGGRLGLPAATSGAVEAHPDQIDFIQAAEGHGIQHGRHPVGVTDWLNGTTPTPSTARSRDAWPSYRNRSGWRSTGPRREGCGSCRSAQARAATSCRCSPPIHEHAT